MQPIKIAHLYPDLLNLYGDRGNVLVLTKRLAWRGIDFVLDEISIAEHNKKLSDYDLFFIGGGQDSQQAAVADDLTIRKNEIVDIVESEKPMLAVCGGYQLLGKSYQSSDGKTIAGLGILDIETKAILQEQGERQDRLVGNVTAELLIDMHIDSDLKNIVGFENHSGRTYLKTAEPFAKVIKGYGNNSEDSFEGAVYKNLIATYLHGSLLPKNPHLADEILWRALSTAKHPYLESHPSLESLDDKLELAAHNASFKR